MIINMAIIIIIDIRTVTVLINIRPVTIIIIIINIALIIIIIISFTIIIISLFLLARNFINLLKLKNLTLFIYFTEQFIFKKQENLQP